MQSVDIVIPNFQYGRYLPECVASILDQGQRNLRILIIDNASTDDSVEIARRLAGEDGRIEVRARAQNLGFQASVNEAIDWASSEYFMILCADDLLTPGALSCAIAIMERHPEVSFAYGKYAMFKAGEPRPHIEQSADGVWTVRTGADYIKRRCNGRTDLTVSPLIRTRFQKKVGHYRAHLQFDDDQEAFLRLARFGSVAVTPRIQGIQRLHEANASQTTWKDPVRRMTEQLAVFDSFFSNEGKAMRGAKDLHRIARRRVGEGAYWSGIVRIVRGDYRSGVNLLKLAVRLTPRAAIIPPVHYLTRVDQPLTRLAGIVLHVLGSKRLGAS
jgi:glycosyltransferase involved in cell wall biosynthesis